MRSGNHRRARRRYLAALAIPALLIAACASTPTRATPAVTISLDGGALIVEGATAQPTRVTKQQAQYDLAHSVNPGHGWRLQEIRFGYVTMQQRIFNDSRTPAPRHRLSWVLFYAAGPSSCGAMGPSTPVVSLPPTASKRLALIVDAATGTALGYTGAGAANCGGPAKPSAGQAYQYVSVPWTDLGGTHVRASFPGCTKLAGTPATGFGPPGQVRWVIEVLGTRPIGPCHASPTTPIVEFTYARPWSHGATGIVPSGSFGI